MNSWEVKIKKKVALDLSIKSKAANMCEKLNPFLKKVSAKPFVGGSVAKETNLPESFDVDIFVIFNKKGDLSNLLEKALKNSGFKFKRVHGSRDYFQIKRDGVVFELVPCLNLSLLEQENVIDQSPEHVKYFLSKSDPKVREQVRITKLFFKANKLYGAESHIAGFSGHVLDLLVLRYGSFFNLLKASLKWKKKVIVDLESQLKNPLMQLDKSKLASPLIVVDPLDKFRNSSAALSNEKFGEFKSIAKEFINNPSLDFFVERSVSFDEFVVIEAKPLSGKESVVFTKALKAFQFFLRKLEEYDFKVSDFKIDYGKPCKLGVKVKSVKLNDYKIVKGPPVSMDVHVQRFKQDHPNFFEEEGFVFAKVKRKFTDLDDLLVFLCKERYVLSRVGSCEVAGKP